MKITDILNKNCILVHRTIKTKEEALNLMIQTLAQSGQLTDPTEVQRVVWEREAIMSTGIGKGFALPHGKTNSVADTVGCFLTLDESINFDALDGLPVNTIFMLIGRENTVGTHLRMLSRISRLMNIDSFRIEVQSAVSSDEIYALFEREESTMF
ncbi:MAG: PTS sugar transporter subunit IIA [Ignavibacteria bacterium]|nr:PTS sugar transporter subunit IIA [Ignavibacteria bacterium]